MTLTLFDAALMAATLSCALTAGLVFGFAVVVMPGIAKLPDREFLQAFKLMDGVIQNRQPIFMIVWVGSIVSVVLMLVLGTPQLSGLELYLMWFASGLYLLAVQGPTLRFNIPLNNGVQALEIELLSAQELAEARTQFEVPWNRWNRFRTLTAIASVVALLVLQLLLR
jgi:uncharacterized membrane protein